VHEKAEESQRKSKLVWVKFDAITKIVVISVFVVCLY